MKKTNSVSGTSYFGTFGRNEDQEHTILNLDGTVNANPYFWLGDLPELDKWYLVVGYVHSADYTSTVKLGGVYDGVTGFKVADATSDLKLSPNSTRFLTRAFLYQDANLDDRQYFYEPRIDIVNGSEPSLEELLNDTSNLNVNSESLWNAEGNTIFYEDGSVGIGTNTVPDGYSFAVAGNTSINGTILATDRISIGTSEDDPGYALTVKGKVHVQEVKVDLLGAIAPDYVFTKEYDLNTLEEVQVYIDQEGHLPNIPSAKEMEREGLHVKQMSLKLLEKIEELTLYTIAQEKAIKEQKEVNDTLLKRLEKLETLLEK